MKNVTAKETGRIGPQAGFRKIYASNKICKGKAKNVE